MKLYVQCLGSFANSLWKFTQSIESHITFYLQALSLIGATELTTKNRLLQTKKLCNFIGPCTKIGVGLWNMLICFVSQLLNICFILKLNLNILNVESSNLIKKTRQKTVDSWHSKAIPFKQHNVDSRHNTVSTAVRKWGGGSPNL